jgi:hypothetical protein
MEAEAMVRRKRNRGVSPRRTGTRSLGAHEGTTGTPPASGRAGGEGRRRLRQHHRHQVARPPGLLLRHHRHRRHPEALDRRIRGPGGSDAQVAGGLRHVHHHHRRPPSPRPRRGRRRGASRRNLHEGDEAEGGGAHRRRRRRRRVGARSIARTGTGTFAEPAAPQVLRHEAKTLVEPTAARRADGATMIRSMMTSMMLTTAGATIHNKASSRARVEKVRTIARRQRELAGTADPRLHPLRRRHPRPRHPVHPIRDRARRTRRQRRSDAAVVTGLARRVDLDRTSAGSVLSSTTVADRGSAEAFFVPPCNVCLFFTALLCKKAY